MSRLLEKVKKSGSAKTFVEQLKAQGRKACYPFRKPTIAEILEQVETCRDALHLAVNLPHLDLSQQMEQKLHLIDEKLTNGLDGIDNALQLLPSIGSDLSTTKNAVLAVRNLVQSSQQQQHLQTVLDWICPTDYGQQLTDILSRHKVGTVGWFLDSPKSQAWVEGPAMTLFCPGNPGTGKTVLTAAVINFLMQKVHSMNSPVVYIFCDYKRQSEQSAKHILSTLLRQIVHVVAQVPPALEELYRYHILRNTRPTVEELEATFRSTVHALSAVYIIIDALDECASKARIETLRFLKGVQERNMLLLFATSRFMPEVQEDMKADLQLEIRASNEDVEAYIENRLSELSRCIANDVSLQKQVVHTICNAVKGMFLLARLHVDSLKAKRTTKAIKLALQHLPQGSDAYNETYEDAMDRICRQPEDDRNVALEALSWSVFARRPLTAQELQEALATEPDSTEIDEDAVIDIDEVLNLCAGLLVRDEHSGTVRLVHYTAHEYISRTAERWIPNAEMTLARKCIAYISFPKFGISPTLSIADVQERFAENAFYRYAARHWGEHFWNCEQKEDDSCMESLEAPARAFLRDKDLVRSAIQAMSRRELLDWQTAHMLATFGSVRLMKLLIDLECPVDLRDKYHRTPLWWAVVNGHERLTRFLLDAGQVESHSRDAFGFTPIYHAVELRDRGIVEMLLEHNSAHVNDKYKSGRTLLSVAAAAGDEPVTRILMKTEGVDLNVRDDYERTPLMLAAAGYYEGIVKLLVGSKDIEINAAANDGASALTMAAERGYEGVVKLLLEHKDIDVDATVTSGHTPLILAASEGYAEVTQLLIDAQESSVDFIDPVGRTPIMWALQSGCEDTIHCLLVAKSRRAGSAIEEIKRLEMERRDFLGCSFIHLSGMRNRRTSIRMALDHNLDINVVDNEGWTPLHWSAYFGSRRAAGLLLELGADKSLPDAHGRACAQFARFAHKHRETLFKLLTTDDTTLLDEVEVERASEHFGVLCDACDHYCTGKQHHCSQCPVPPGYDLCFRCFSGAHLIHPNHDFVEGFRYPDRDFEPTEQGPVIKWE